MLVARMLHQWASWLPVLFIALFVSTPALGHTIEVQASQKECFFEDLHIHDKVRTFYRVVICNRALIEHIQMTITYQVGGGGHMDIDFWVNFACLSISRVAANRTLSSWRTQVIMRSTSSINNLRAQCRLRPRRMAATNIASRMR